MTAVKSMRASLNLETRYENIVLAERVLGDMLEICGLSGDEDYWLVTALREALANAMRHGNKENEDLVVKAELRIDEAVLTVLIADEGEGFDPTTIPDPTDPENLLRPCGRGIFYMNRFMDVVQFSQNSSGGTLVEMKKRITDTQDKENAP
jgi:serine/threonine-protein kinase RsbW